jgi:hypothetical protein
VKSSNPYAITPGPAFGFVPYSSLYYITNNIFLRFNLSFFKWEHFERRTGKERGREEIGEGNSADEFENLEWIRELEHYC